MSSIENILHGTIMTDTIETVEPIGKRVLIRKDEDKKQTKGGIQLPDNIEIPTISQPDQYPQNNRKSKQNTSCVPMSYITPFNCSRINPIISRRATVRLPATKKKATKPLPFRKRGPSWPFYLCYTISANTLRRIDFIPPFGSLQALRLITKANMSGFCHYLNSFSYFRHLEKSSFFSLHFYCLC